MARNKLPEGQRKDEIVGVRCEPALKRKLDRIARKKGLTLVQVMRAALSEYADKAAA